MTLTPEILKQIAPGNRNPKLLADLAHWMNEWFPKFDIDTVKEYRHILAQLAHESDSFNAMEEYATGEAYEGRKDLGNVHEGDGVRYKGRGPIQNTGRANYYALGVKLKKPDMFILHPELLATPEWGVWAACVYWSDRHLNDYANKPDDALIVTKKHGRMSPLKYITYRINGGFNGFDSRMKFYERAKKYII